MSRVHTYLEGRTDIHAATLSSLRSLAIQDEADYRDLQKSFAEINAYVAGLEKQLIEARQPTAASNNALRDAILRAQRAESELARFTEFIEKQAPNLIDGWLFLQVFPPTEAKKLTKPTDTFYQYEVVNDFSSLFVCSCGWHGKPEVLEEHRGSHRS